MAHRMRHVVQDSLNFYRVHLIAFTIVRQIYLARLTRLGTTYLFRNHVRYFDRISHFLHRLPLQLHVRDDSHRARDG